MIYQPSKGTALQRPLVLLALVFSCANVFAQVACDCTEYIYLNEPAASSVLKFEVVPGQVELNMLTGANGGPYWYPGTTVSELREPHGLAADVNGNLYIGETGGNSLIRKLDCEGNLEPVGPTTIDNMVSAQNGQNFFLIGSTLYVNAVGGPAAYNSCTGDLIGIACLGDAAPVVSPTPPTNGNQWGLSYNPVTGMVYASDRLPNGERKIWSFTVAQLEASIADNGATCIDPLIRYDASVTTPSPGDNLVPNTPGNLLGVVGDNDGNIYAVIGLTRAGMTVLKYDAFGRFIAQSPVSTNTSPYGASIGIVWSDVTNQLYVSNFTDDNAIDCISVFDAETMAYVGTGAPNPGITSVGSTLDDRAKAIFITKECCPPTGTTTLDTTVCMSSFESVTIQDLIGCVGPVCGGEWMETMGSPNITFDVCTNELTPTGGGCAQYTLTGGGTTGSACPSFTLVINVCFTTPPEAVVTPVCVNNADGTNSFSLTAAVSSSSVYDGNTANLLLNGTQVATGVLDANGSFTFSVDPLNIDESFGNTYLVEIEGASTCNTASGVFDLVACTPDCVDGPSSLGGNAFLDDSYDGVLDADETGQANILVTVYDCLGNVACEVYTNADGNWSCDGLNPGEDYRVEFSTPLQPWLTETLAGTDNGTNVQFVTAGTCGANYGVNDPNTCPPETAFLATPCYINGDAATNEEVFVIWSYNNVGETGQSIQSPQDKRAGATDLQAGALWGTAYNNNDGVFYASALLKRQIGLGPGGLDAIYEIDPFTGSPNADVWLELNDDLGIDVGTIGTNAERGLAAGGENRDAVAYGSVGKVGIGDIDINRENTTLYVMNLFDKTVYAIDIATKTVVGTFPVPDPGCTNGESRPWALNVRDDGSVFVGVVCDGSGATVGPPDPANTSSRASLSATVYQLIGSTYNEVLSFPLDYPREPANGFTADCNAITDGWYGWVDESVPVCGANIVVYPTPILTDIEFTQDGAMVLGFLDRTGLQINNGAPPPIDGEPFVDVNAAGDILYACSNGAGGFDIEGTNGCANANGGAINGTNNTYPGPFDLIPQNDGTLYPNVGEYFVGDFYRNADDPANLVAEITTPFFYPAHAEIALGGLVILPGSDEVVATAYDPVTSINPGFGRGGVIKLDLASGRRLVNGFELYNSEPVIGDNLRTAGKGVGLGDLEVFCQPPPIQLGNYAWLDTDGDGLQDPCEPPLVGLAVKLYRKDANGGAPVLIATDTTDATGNYYFSSAEDAMGNDNQNWIGTGADTILQRTESYFIAFCGDDGYDAGQGLLTLDGLPLCISPADAGQAPSDEQNDSNISEQTVGNETLPAYCTEDGELENGTNHTFDAGFKVVCPFVELVSNTPSICGTDSVTLSAIVDSVFVAEPYQYAWSTSGDGMFLNAAGMATMDYATAITYLPGTSDRSTGTVTLSLRSTTATTPGACDEAVDMITIQVLNVDCGSFFWDGN